MHLADSLGINLIEIPIALDAFVFLANINNSINSLTTKEIQDIYTGSVTHWNEVGETNTVIREDLDKSSSAHKLHELLLTASGQSVVIESGYIPYY